MFSFDVEEEIEGWIFFITFFSYSVLFHLYLLWTIKYIICHHIFKMLAEIFIL